MVNWEDGQLVQAGYVEIDGVQYPIVEAVYEGNTPASAFNLNKMQKDLMVHKYTKVIETAQTGQQELIIPCYYKVGIDCLDVYLNGEKLIKATAQDGSDGHYKEVGEANTISNKILIGNDNYTIAVGDIFEFEVKGEYTNVENT